MPLDLDKFIGKCDLSVFVANRLGEIRDDLQVTIVESNEYDIALKRTEVLHKTLLLSVLVRHFDLYLATPDYKLLFDLIANQATFK